MAREPKIGLDFFPVDIGFIDDDKILLLRDEFGCDCLWYVIKLWDKIYGDKGWYCSFDDDSCRLMSQRVGIDGKSSKYLKELVNGCVRRSLFDERVFSMFGVLTSKRIQFNYFYAKRETIKKRVMQGVKERVWSDIFLLDEHDLKKLRMTGFFEYTQKEESSGKILNNSGNKSDNSGDIQHSKVNKTIINNNNKIEELFDLFETEFGRPISPIELQTISDLLNEYPKELIKLALTESVKNNARSMNYITTVLNNWRMSGIKTVEEAQLRIQQFKDRKNRSSTSNKQTKRTLPEWYENQQKGIEDTFGEADEQDIEEFKKMLEEMEV